MKRFSLLISLLCIMSLSAFSLTGNEVLNKMIQTYKSSKGIAANYTIIAQDGRSKGSIVMQGDKFRMASSDLLCWYNGKTQWSYSTMSGEVNIMEPTNEELQIVNPFSIISNFQNAYNASLLTSRNNASLEVKLTPKSSAGSDVKSVVMTVAKSSYLPSKIVFTMKDNSVFSISLSQYQTGANFPASLFVYDKKMVPAGTPVIDLR